MADAKQLVVRVRRQDGPDGAVRHDVFHVDRIRGMTVADVLFAINESAPSPIVWNSACTWPACGVCTMVINRRAAPACGTEVDELLGKRKKLTLEPLTGFDVRRDLLVDRSRMVRNAARAEAFVDDEATTAIASLHAFSACTRCGACVDACPEAGGGSTFMGPYALGAMHATKIGRGAALPLSVLEPGGIADCGHVQNCVETCPERVPLDRAIRSAAKAGVKQWWSGLFKRS